MTNGETFFTYDANGNELSHTLPDNSSSTPETETYTYNQYGQVATHVDFDGNTATYTYYSGYGNGAYAGSVESVVYTGATGSGKATETVSYTYDSLGRQATVTDASGTTTDSYDAQGNLDEQQTPEGTVWYVFSPVTGEHVETYTNYTDTKYGYNTQGELTSVTVDELNGNSLLPNTSTPPLVTSYTYDGAGNTLTETLPDGELTRYAYDNLNRLTSMNESQGTTTLFSETLVLNDDGSRKSATETQRQTDATTSTLDYAWGYDADGRLTSESLSATGDAAAGDYSDNYSYDLNGNQITKVQTTSAGTETTTNTYNGDNELTQSVDSSTGTTIYGYDANGSQTSSTNGGNVTTYTYDVRNRLSSVTTGGVTTTYGYDDAGNRVSETTSGTQGGTTYYLVDSQNLTGYDKPLEVKVGSTTAAPTTTYILGLDVIGQVNSSGAVSYLLLDGQDNTRALVNSSGVVTATFNYNAFGNVLGATYTPSSPPPTIFLFQQMMYDSASGLNFTESRQTPMGSSYWIERDPDGYSSNDDPITLNSTLLDGGNPISNIDLNGHDFSLVGELVEDTAEASLDSTGLSVLPAATEAASETVDLVGLYSRLAMYLGASIATGGTAIGVSYYWLKTLQQIQLHQNAVAKAYQQAIQTATSTGKYTKQQVNNMPVFYVFLTGPGATPQIGANDLAAMAGVGTKGGLPAPDVLNYVPGINAVNGPAARGWARSVGIIGVSGVTSLDEYPYASTGEGGVKPWLRVTPVAKGEQVIQGGDLSLFYGAQGFHPFTFLVVVVP